MTTGRWTWGRYTTSTESKSGDVSGIVIFRVTMCWSTTNPFSDYSGTVYPRNRFAEEMWGQRIQAVKDSRCGIRNRKLLTISTDDCQDQSMAKSWHARYVRIQSVSPSGSRSDIALAEVAVFTTMTSWGNEGLNRTCLGSCELHRFLPRALRAPDPLPGFHELEMRRVDLKDDCREGDEHACVLDWYNQSRTDTYELKTIVDRGPSASGESHGCWTPGQWAQPASAWMLCWAWTPR